MDKKPFFSPIYSRTAILLYVSLAANAAMFHGILVPKDKLTFTVCTSLQETIETQKDDNSLIDAIDRKLGKAKTVELQE